MRTLGMLLFSALFACAATTPAADYSLLVGEWRGWGTVVIEGRHGGYSETLGTGPGMLELTEVAERMYVGTWSESPKRHGTLRIVLSDDGGAIAGTWRPDPDCEIGDKEGGIIQWRRGPPPLRPGQRLESVEVPNDRPVRVKTQTVLQQGKWYVIEASGDVSNWSDVERGVDPVWCYLTDRCGAQGQMANQLRIAGQSITDLAGEPVPYNPRHVYTIRYQGRGTPLELHSTDAQNSSHDNSGSWNVTLYEAVETAR